MSELSSLLDTDEEGHYILPPKRTFLVTAHIWNEEAATTRVEQVMIEAHSVSQTDGTLRFHEFTCERIKTEQVLMQWERRAFAKGVWMEFIEVFTVSLLVH